MDDLLPKYAPELQAAVPAGAWAATKVGGKMYGVPNQQIWVKPFGPTLRKDLLEKYKVDWATIKKLEDLEPFFAAVKAANPVYSPAKAAPTSANTSVGIRSSLSPHKSVSLMTTRA